MREKWNKFREWDKKGLLVERVKGSKAYTKKGYVIDRRIFRVYFFLLVLPAILYVVLTAGVGWSEFYVSCPIDGYGECKNPFYLNCDREECRQIESREFLPRGFQLGEKPSKEFKNQVLGVELIAFGGFLVALGLNHFWHNKRKKLSDLFPDLELRE